MKNLITSIMGFALAAYVAAPAYAFTPFQGPILSRAAIAPNVMFLIDNSGSMNNLIFAPDFDAGRDYGLIHYSNSDTSDNADRRIALNMTDNFLAYASTLKRGRCSNGYKALWDANRNNKLCIKLPDPVADDPDDATVSRITAQYLSFIYNKYRTLGSIDLTALPDSEFPQSYRMKVARDVAASVVTTNGTGVRFGLAAFATNNTSAGGFIRQSVSDDYSRVVNSIEGLYGTTSTPLAEAYYDVTRYFRGLSSTNNSRNTSPIQYRCQKNFGIVVTDGYPTNDTSFFNANSDPLRNNPDVAGEINIPNWDGLAPFTSQNDLTPPRYSDGFQPSGRASDERYSLYLDDIAKFAYDVDLRDLNTPDQAGVSFNDSGFRKQNMFTYTVGFTVANQMLSDAAEYGRGSYYTATNAAELNDSLTRALNEISAKAGSGGAGASSSATLTTETYYYKTLYNPEDWRGTIEAYRLSPTTGRPLSNDPNWSTDTRITPSSNGASYQTFNGSGMVNLDYANLSAQQQAEVSASVTAPLTGADLINWSKGQPITGLRTRNVLLGDIINSSLESLTPEVALASALTGDLTYDAFLVAKRAQMTSSLLVNSNAGFFHVINANNGSHRYGYMPSSLLDSLHIVAAPDYASSGSHRFMVDGLISLADTQLGSQWATVAVSGMGAGGKSMFAVKLFDGDNNIEALWEVSPPEVSDTGNEWNNLGYTYSKPVIARTSGGRWVALFGNGYGSHQGKASLYVVDIEDGELIREIIVDQNTSGSATEIAAGNGLSSPQVVLNSQYQIEAVYAGDLRGNMWKLDIDSGSSRKVFAAGTEQQITVAPLVVDHPEGGSLVLFGTGKLSESADKLDKSEQVFYAIWDKEGSTGEVAKGDLLAQQITDEVTVRGEDYIQTSEFPVDWAVHSGWYLPLVYRGQLEGERVIYPALTTLGRVIFVTAKVDADDPCESSGSGRLVELDLFSGGMLSYPVLDTNGDGVVDDNDVRVSGLNINDGLPGLPVIVDKGAGKPTQTKIILLSTGQAKFVDEKANSVGVSRRIMWRQLQ
ncbi:PilC/PilY family type IV pilus protein [Pseudomonas sp. GOM6]|uniref:pilus assembly protein n=1 Tax=Pseudomonas sp. GOM6 TaxID=3036944 RepID=UPI00240A0E92|nr:PilC/PilY family type IV pilus protein [Pseudomonas sp. GOM6]MDG1582087.1 PilC/PilY family type IV pilus protein [Pseudomonas sp. GOM6]